MHAKPKRWRRRCTVIRRAPGRNARRPAGWCAPLPGDRVEVLRRRDRAVLGRLEQSEPHGLFAGIVSDGSPYLLRINWAGAVQETGDLTPSVRRSAISICICSMKAGISS